MDESNELFLIKVIVLTVAYFKSIAIKCSVVWFQVHKELRPLRVNLKIVNFVTHTFEVGKVH